MKVQQTFEKAFSLQTKDSRVDFIRKTEKDVLSKPDNFELYFEEEQFEDFIEWLKSFRINYVHDVTEYPWGQRVIRFYDPDMHMIELEKAWKPWLRDLLGRGCRLKKRQNVPSIPLNL